MKTYLEFFEPTFVFVRCFERVFIPFTSTWVVSQFSSDLGGVVAFDKELKKKRLLQQSFQFFIECLDSGAKIERIGTRISLFFTPLSNETTATKTERKLWDYLHFWWDLFSIESFFLEFLVGSKFDSFQVRRLSIPKIIFSMIGPQKAKIHFWGGGLKVILCRKFELHVPMLLSLRNKSEILPSNVSYGVFTKLNRQTSDRRQYIANHTTDIKFRLLSQSDRLWSRKKVHEE